MKLWRQQWKDIRTANSVAQGQEGLDGHWQGEALGSEVPHNENPAQDELHEIDQREEDPEQNHRSGHWQRLERAKIW